MQIGDKVWVFNDNKRLYKDDKGNDLDRCWYRGHFEEKYIILGENKQNWIIGHKDLKSTDKICLKVNKKDLVVKGYALGKKLYLSEEEIDQACWMEENKYNLLDKLRYINDYEIFKQIEKLINYKSKE